MNNNETCIFCTPDDRDIHDIIDQNDLAYARWDNFPAAEGHAEVIPRRHVESFFQLSDDEVLAVYGLAKAAQYVISAKYKPEGFTIGVNDGLAAGRTVHHLHLHLIPRHFNDVPAPRGGIVQVLLGPGNSNH
ncbi:MAG: histidine triad protein [Candidatus Saccharibacteria bacterium]|nr:histidine triad protein [Candidatus Saccharibacteria bacterium]